MANKPFKEGQKWEGPYSSSSKGKDTMGRGGGRDESGDNVGSAYGNVSRRAGEKGSGAEGMQKDPLRRQKGDL